MFSLPLNIERSIIVSKPAEEIFEIISDFNSWKSWSPWLCQEPDCPVEISGEAGQCEHAQQWDGKRIGSGRMILSSFKVPDRIDYELTFLKPWKSKSKVAFELTSLGNDTKVTWYMWGSLPLFLFFMRSMMSSLVANDYERGLSMLKEYLETGSVASQLNIVGEVKQDGFYYIGKRHACGLKDVGPMMEQDFSELYALVQSGKLEPADFPISFYHQYDLVTKRCEYTSGFAYRAQPSSKIETFESGHITDHSVMKVEHLGAYRHLGNAWSAVQGLLRANSRKASKVIPMYEIYENFPGQVAEKEIKTLVHIPLR